VTVHNVLPVYSIQPCYCDIGEEIASERTLALVQAQMVDLSFESSSCLVDVPQYACVSVIDHHYGTSRHILRAGLKTHRVLRLEITRLEGAASYIINILPSSHSDT